MAKKKQRKIYLKKNIVPVLLLIIMIWLAVTLITNQLRSVLVQTMEVSNQVLEYVDEGYGMVKGPEVVLSAPVDGVLEPVVPQGDRVRKGNAVYKVNGVIAYTNHAGLVSYQIDGLEYVMDLSAVWGVDWEKLYQQQSQTQEETELEAGTACAKIQDTFDDVSVYTKTAVSDYTNSLNIDDVITVRFEEIDYEGRGKIVEILRKEDSCFLKLDMYGVRDLLFQQRMYQIVLPYQQVSAIAVPVSAIVDRDGQPGVYYLQKGFVFWHAVTLGEEREDDTVIVQEGLHDGDLIVTTPHFVREGENIKF